MTYYGGRGPMTNAILWVEVVVFAVFAGLRLYTRKYILNAIGLDDYLVIIALVRSPNLIVPFKTDKIKVLHILYTAFVTVATAYGLGRLFADVGDPVIYFTAVKYELFSQVAGLMVIGVGKGAVGLFLLRIVRNKFQIWIIWGCLVITAFITLFASVTVIVQCVPVQKSWNSTTPGHCWLEFSNVGYTVGCEYYISDRVAIRHC
jgi:hypothetical protein